VTNGSGSALLQEGNGIMKNITDVYHALRQEKNPENVWWVRRTKVIAPWAPRGQIIIYEDRLLR